MSEEKKSWFEDRLEMKKPWDWFLHRKVPKGVGWWYTLGSATLSVFIIQLFTGLFLMLNYSPSPDHAYDSIRYLVTAVPFGSFIRSVHFYGASAMVILIGVHLIRVYFMAAYRYPRELTWIVGVLLLILVMGSSFTGYLLPWDQRAYWATNVASGIAGEVPLIGTWIQKILIGGSQIGTLTLTRFFTFHVGVMPSLIILLVGFHIFMVVRQGISAPPGRMKFPALSGKGSKEDYQKAYEASKEGGESFFPDSMVRDALVSLVIVAVIFTLAAVFPHHSEAPADPTSTTYNPRPEWYFLLFFQFLKLFPGSLEPVAAVLIPAVAFLILLIVPFLSRGLKRHWSQRKVAVGIGGLAVVILAALEINGALAAPSRQVAELSPQAIEGQALYRDVNCSYCHAINGVGGAVGPDLSNIAAKLSKDQIMNYLRNPDAMVPNTLHPKLQFTQDELDALTAYLLTLGAPANYSPDAPVLFQKNCSSCHTINGQGGDEGPDLSSVGSRRSATFLEPFISDPRSVVPGASMPAFHNVLTPEQIKDIAAYLSSLKGQTAPSTPSPK
jgi:ubiquinol-cytochrome c reductase cytochrome b subunit